jgi:phosphatidate cytidylyltransferase
MHLKRWLTSLVALPLVVLLILKGGTVLFSLIVGLIVIVSLWEYFEIVFKNHEPHVPRVFSLWAYFCGAAIVAAVHSVSYLGVLLILVFHLIGVGLLCIQRFKITSDAPLVAAKQMFGMAYIPLLLSFLVVLRNGNNGIVWVSFVLWVVAWGDIGAYYVGSYLGRHKLCPAVSPKKTVEGALGGLGANLISALAFAMLFTDSTMSLRIVVIALTAGVLGQAGDLFESLFKRAAGVKDSGGILPGHGGFLDRLDALMFAAPAVFVLKEYVLP